MKHLVSLSYLLFLTLASNAQLSAKFTWAKSFGASNYGYGYGVIVDRFGNVYTTGLFRDTVDFDPGSGKYELMSAGQGDIFVSKLDASGNFVWAIRIGSINNDVGNAIALDDSGNVYITGTFMATVDFDPGAGVHTLTVPANTFNSFILKLDANGNFIWVKQFASSTNVGSYSIRVNAGGIFTTGNYNGIVNFDPGPGTFNLTSLPTAHDIFISKLDINGDFVWAKKFSGTASYDNFGTSLCLDASGNIYSTGRFQGTTDFDPGTNTFNLNSAGTYDCYIVKLDASGAFVWAKRAGASGSDEGDAIAVDAFGNSYVTGIFQSTVDFDPGAATFNLVSAGNLNSYILKLNIAGNFVWAKSMVGFSSTSESIALDQSGNIYTTGRFDGKVDFDPGIDTFYMINNGNAVIISKLNSAGDFVMAKKIAANYTYSIFVDSLNNIYTTGTFKGTGDFDPGAGIFNLTALKVGDVFVEKMGTCQPSSSIYSYTTCGTFTFNGTIYYSSGTYKQTINNSIGCDSNMTLNLTINTAINDSVILSGAILTAKTTGAIYQWVKCPGYAIVPGANGRSYTASVSGDYAVIISLNGCIDTSKCITATKTGIDQPNIQDGYFNIYPNPSNGSFIILSNKDGYYSICNVLGKVILTFELNNINDHRAKIEDVDDGIYFIKGTINNQELNRKILVRN